VENNGMGDAGAFRALGLYLKKRRIQKGFTQSEVAQKLGYGSPQFISNIERGISSVPVKSLKIFVNLYEVPAEEVLEILLDEKRRYLSEQLGLGGVSPGPVEHSVEDPLEDQH
jgi:transcriptional regulator with XRE-family HTH domain